MATKSMTKSKPKSKSKPKPKTVDDYLAGLSKPHRELAEGARSLIRAAAPKLTETVKWGCPCFVGAANVCSIIAYKSTVNIALFRGAELANEHGLLEGTGQSMRHIALRTPDDLRRKQVPTILRQAARLDAAEAKTPA